jgi:hypothetical protein
MKFEVGGKRKRRTRGRRRERGRKKEREGERGGRYSVLVKIMQANVFHSFILSVLLSLSLSITYCYLQFIVPKFSKALPI